MNSNMSDNIPVRTVELELTIAIGGENAVDVISLYESSFIDDINQTAWNLCDCSDEVQAHKFGQPALKEYSFLPGDDGTAKVKIFFQVVAEESAFIEEVVSEYIDGFSDWIRVIQNGLYSRTGSRIGMDIELLEWDMVSV